MSNDIQNMLDRIKVLRDENADLLAETKLNKAYIDELKAQTSKQADAIVELGKKNAETDALLTWHREYAFPPGEHTGGVPISSLFSKISELESENAKMKMDMDTTTDSIGEMSEEIRRLEEENNKLIAEGSRLSAEKHIIQNSAQIGISDKDKRIETLEATIKRWRDAHDSLDEKLKLKQQRIEEMEESMERQKERWKQEMDIGDDHFDKDLSAMQNMLQKKNEEIESLKKTIDHEQNAPCDQSSKMMDDDGRTYILCDIGGICRCPEQNENSLRTEPVKFCPFCAGWNNTNREDHTRCEACRREFRITLLKGKHLDLKEEEEKRKVSLICKCGTKLKESTQEGYMICPKCKDVAGVKDGKIICMSSDPPEEEGK